MTHPVQGGPVPSVLLLNSSSEPKQKTLGDFGFKETSRSSSGTELSKRKVTVIEGQRSLKEFGFHSKEKRQRISSQVKESYDSFKKPSIGIPYRNDGAGRGADYDHRSLQAASSGATTLLKTADMCTSPMKYVAKQRTQQLKHKIPQLVASKESGDGYGLLFIPGISRSVYESAEREEREEFQGTLIKQALLEGRPILAVCGGCWQLWEKFGGKTKEVREHSYRGGMPRILQSTGKVGNNKQVHRVGFGQNSQILLGAMRLEQDARPTVNSVHWKAPVKSNVSHVQVSAISIADDQIAPLITNKGMTRPLKPERCIEAFESESGAPILGIQWHPEAYQQGTSHAHSIRYMEEAGRAFNIKKKMLLEIKAIFAASTEAATAMERHGLNRTKQGRKFLLRKQSRYTKVLKQKEIIYTHLFETEDKVYPKVPLPRKKRSSKVN